MEVFLALLYLHLVTPNEFSESTSGSGEPLVLVSRSSLGSDPVNETAEGDPTRQQHAGVGPRRSASGSVTPPLPVSGSALGSGPVAGTPRGDQKETVADLLEDPRSQLDALYSPIRSFNYQSYQIPARTTQAGADSENVTDIVSQLDALDAQRTPDLPIDQGETVADLLEDPRSRLDALYYLIRSFNYQSYQIPARTTQAGSDSENVTDIGYRLDALDAQRTPDLPSDQGETVADLLEDLRSQLDALYSPFRPFTNLLAYGLPSDQTHQIPAGTTQAGADSENVTDIVRAIRSRLDTLDAQRTPDLPGDQGETVFDLTNSLRSEARSFRDRIRESGLLEQLQQVTITQEDLISSSGSRITSEGPRRRRRVETTSSLGPHGATETAIAADLVPKIECLMSQNNSLSSEVARLSAELHGYERRVERRDPNALERPKTKKE